MNKILIIEDDRDISALIKLNLEYSSFIVEQAFNGEEGLFLIKEKSYDLIILDLMLPGLNGFSLLPHINREQIPVLILSARDSLTDRVRGLDQGADDYLVKPFDFLELTARVKALLRRFKPRENTLEVEGLIINLQKQTVFNDENEIILTLKEYQLLTIMAENPGVVFSREVLLDRIWGYTSHCDTRTVDMHIKRLRSKVGVHVVKTVYKRGYKV